MFTLSLSFFFSYMESGGGGFPRKGSTQKGKFTVDAYFMVHLHSCAIPAKSKLWAYDAMEKTLMATQTDLPNIVSTSVVFILSSCPCRLLKPSGKWILHFRRLRKKRLSHFLSNQNEFWKGLGNDIGGRFSDASENLTSLQAAFQTMFDFLLLFHTIKTIKA